MKLKEKRCVPCEGGVDPLTETKIREFLDEISDGWKPVKTMAIKREFPFKNFKQGMDFANRVAEIAEEENHHPDMCIHYSKVVIELSTHAIGGLSENDFIVAAKIDELT